MDGRGIWRFFAAGMLLAAGGTSAAEETPQISNLRSCYGAEFSDEDSFIASIEARQGRALPPNAADGARAEYRRLTGGFDCELFDYDVDGLTVQGFRIQPMGPADDPLPVVIFNRGGNADTGALPLRYLIGKLYPLVEAGFIVVGSQYRGARIDGVESPDRLRDEFGGADVDDVLALLPIIDTLPRADGARVGLYGWSRGGMMSFIAARRSERFSAMVVGGAPTDIAAELAWRPDMEVVLNNWVPDFASNRDAALAERSVLAWTEELPEDLPILILHGNADERVSANSALALAQRLQDLQRPYRLVIYDGGSHGLREFEAQTRREAIDWFSRHLTGAQSPAESP